MKRITIDPVTRLEGHGKIEIFLDEEGEVANAFMQIPEFRGFEKFCEGRPAEELPRITPRICGVCPPAHHLASTKACDALWKVDPPSPAKKLRELFYSAYYFADHLLAFYYLQGPDLIVGPTAPAAKRNILGVIEKVGLDVGKEVIKHRAYGQKILQMLGGKPIHPTWGIPGGVTKGFTEEERAEVEEMAKSAVEFGKFTLKAIDDIVLKNKEYVDLILSDPYTISSYYMGLVDENNKVNFYDGDIRVVDPEGKEFAKFKPHEYLNYIEEHVEPWTYLKFPYLKGVGWKGFVGGKDSGVYRVAPLARLNAADGMATPIAQEEYEKFYQTLGGKPVPHTLATNWARVIEMMYAAEHLLELIQDEEITSDNIRIVPTETPTEGVGVVEACRGTLYHHYQTDPDGIITKVNLIVATVNNSAAICMSIKKAAQGVIKKGKVDDGILNMVEMAFRAYDPCFACGTHTLPGQMPLEVNIYNHHQELIQTFKR